MNLYSKLLDKGVLYYLLRQSFVTYTWYLSLVRTGKSGFGFLQLYNRLNVSMSRQKKLLVAVGDAAFYDTDQAREQVPGLADFLKVCRNQGRVL